MKCRVLTLSFCPALGGFNDAPLQEALRDVDALSVQQHLFFVEARPFLTLVLLYSSLGKSTTKDNLTVPRKKSLKEQSTPLNELNKLNKEQSVLAESIRTWRKTRAHADGVPPYVVLTNRELHEIIRVNPLQQTT